MYVCRPKGHGESPGFMVYITVPGVVTHKVPFTASSDYNGEYNFNIHGLHYIDASDEFRRWNKEKKVTGDKSLAVSGILVLIFKSRTIFF
jgi:hypothetical protein